MIPFITEQTNNLGFEKGVPFYGFRTLFGHGPYFYTSLTLPALLLGSGSVFLIVGTRMFNKKQKILEVNT